MGSDRGGDGQPRNPVRHLAGGGFCLRQPGKGGCERPRNRVRAQRHLVLAAHLHQGIFIGDALQLEPDVQRLQIRNGRIARRNRRTGPKFVRRGGQIFGNLGRAPCDHAQKQFEQGVLDILRNIRDRKGRAGGHQATLSRSARPAK